MQFFQLGSITLISFSATRIASSRAPWSSPVGKGEWRWSCPTRHPRPSHQWSSRLVRHHLGGFEMFVFGCCFLHLPKRAGLVRKSNFKSDKVLWSWKGVFVARETACKGETDPIWWMYNQEKKQMLSFWSGSNLLWDGWEEWVPFLGHRLAKLCTLEEIYSSLENYG